MKREFTPRKEGLNTFLNLEEDSKSSNELKETLGPNLNMIITRVRSVQELRPIKRAFLCKKLVMKPLR